MNMIHWSPVPPGHGCSTQVTVGDFVVSVCGNQTPTEICELRMNLPLYCIPTCTCIYIVCVSGSQNEDIQWNSSKADNLVPQILSIIAGCPLWRGFAG